MSYNQTEEFKKKFLTERDESGRFIVVSYKTGKKYFIEPIGPDRSADWGSVNPATKKIENKKGHDKFRGSIDETDSMITVENGFNDIRYSGIGASPFNVIEEMDNDYQEKQLKNK